eukprot:TRINITY_DN35587_c0_g1_i1.p1 TRINITY_DN35587_c0_g1~~TRINITY_DN35587_c0_g1_i1.p1  ORF type:complete len:174 (+),score=20.29 TRINITY_DN35587_c0_g1_i1:142-663(+)
MTLAATLAGAAFPVLLQSSCQVRNGCQRDAFVGLRAAPSVAPRKVCSRTEQREERSRIVSPRADIDADTIVAVGVAFAGIALGIGVPIFYEMQTKGAEMRENDQPCFPCRGTGAQTCRFCLGSGNITVELGGGEREVSKCVNCEGGGSITCTTCQGSGIQPRYLDRREYKDDD